MYLFSKKRLFRRSYTTSPSYVETESTRRMKRYRDDATPTMVRSMYEGRIGHLERSLSREKLNKDRLRTEYHQLSNKLDQAVRQMELLSPITPSNSLAELRRPRPSIAYTVASHAIGPNTERWRRGNVLWSGMYSRPWNDEILRKTISYYTACAAKRQ